MSRGPFPTGFSPYSTDDFGHVDLVLQTRVSENWVDNAYLTQNLKNAKVSVKIDKGGKAQVSVTGLKSDNGIDLMEVEAVYKNNTEIGTAECDLVFTPLAKSDKAYIGSKVIKFRID